jgi:hypothetical protein
MIWGFAGLGLLSGGVFANWLGKQLSFKAYKITVLIDVLVNGVAYVLFSREPRFGLALVFIFVSRVGMSVNSVLNYSYLLRTVANRYRGRVFATIDTFEWTMMMISMMGAGIASTRYDPRVIGVVAGILSSTTAIFWAWANWTGRLPCPVLAPGPRPLPDVQPGLTV